MKRLTITFDIAFGKDEEIELEEAPGDVYSSTERRPSEDATEARAIGFGRPQVWED